MGRLAGSLLRSQSSKSPQHWQKLWEWLAQSCVSTSPPNGPGHSWRLSDYTKMQAYGRPSMVLASLQPCKDRSLVVEKLRVMQMFLSHKSEN